MWEGPGMAFQLLKGVGFRFETHVIQKDEMLLRRRVG